MNKPILWLTMTTALLLVACGANPTNQPTENTLPTTSGTVPTATPTLPTASNQVTANTNATATPLSRELEPGEARRIAMATDIPMQPDIEDPQTFDSFPVSLTFDDFYAGFDLRKGLLMTEKIQSLDGNQVVIEGYVAPPLKPRIDFFVLTRIQLAFCPFCSADTEWPTDIALVYMPEQNVMATDYPVRVTGQLELGTSTDAETGMVSVIRVYADEIEQIRN